MDEEILTPDADSGVGKPLFTEPTTSRIIRDDVTTLSADEFDRHMQESRTNKASLFLGWSIFLVVLVFSADFFFDGESELTTEVVRIFSSVITFLLGYLFASTKK